MQDNRNVLDEFKGLSHEVIVEQLDARGVLLEIAIENLERDFNMGTIIRSANAFGIRTVHIIGRRQWNKRGAMMTDKYLNVIYHNSVDTFVEHMRSEHPTRVLLVGVDNVSGAVDLTTVDKLENAVLIFGSEANGLSSEMLAHVDTIVQIPQRGSTRSLNVGVAAGIVMWEWLR